MTYYIATTGADGLEFELQNGPFECLADTYINLLNFPSKGAVIFKVNMEADTNILKPLLQSSETKSSLKFNSPSNEQIIDLARRASILLARGKIGWYFGEILPFSSVFTSIDADAHSYLIEIKNISNTGAITLAVLPDEPPAGAERSVKSFSTRLAAHRYLIADLRCRKAGENYFLEPLSGVSHSRRSRRIFRIIGLRRSDLLAI